MTWHLSQNQPHMTRYHIVALRALPPPRGELAPLLLPPLRGVRVPVEGEEPPAPPVLGVAVKLGRRCLPLLGVAGASAGAAGADAKLC